MINRRTFFLGLAAPAVIRTPGLLMPVRRVMPVGATYSLEVNADLAPYIWAECFERFIYEMYGRPKSLIKFGETR